MKDKYKILTGQTLSVLGTAVTEKALPILILAFSGDPTLAALIKTWATVPMLLLAPLLGVWTEGLQPRALVALNVVFAITSVVLVVAVKSKVIWAITLALFSAQIVQAIFIPLYNKTLVILTPEPGEGDKVAKQQSIASRIATSVGEGCAPFLAAKVGAFAFLLDAGSFILAAFVAFTLPASWAIARAKVRTLAETAGVEETALAIVAEAPRSRSAKAMVKQMGFDLLEGLKIADKGLLLLLLVSYAVWTSEGYVLPKFESNEITLGALFVTKSLTEALVAGAMLKFGWNYSNKVLTATALCLGFSSLVLASATTFGMPAEFAAMVLSGIGSNVVGTGVNKRLAYSDSSATARLSSLIGFANIAGGLIFVNVVTQIAKATSPAISFTAAGAIMIGATLLVFLFIRPRNEV